MYIIKDKTYPEAGMFLVGTKSRGFGCPTEFGPFTETTLDISSLDVDSYAIHLTPSITWPNPGIRTYADAKKFVVGVRYSNDDQIAIILNKDNSEEDALAFQKMQEWRDWAAVVAHKIMEELSKQ